MPVTPEGMISLPMQYLRLSIANSARFQTWTATANETEALDKIHWNALDDPPSNLDSYTRAGVTAVRPYVVVWLPVPYDNQRDAVGPHQFRAVPRVAAYFEDNVTSGLNHADAWLTFANNLGIVLEEVGAMSGDAQRLAIKSFEIADWDRTTLDGQNRKGDSFYADVVFEVDN